MKDESYTSDITLYEDGEGTKVVISASDHTSTSGSNYGNLDRQVTISSASNKTATDGTVFGSVLKSEGKGEVTSEKNYRSFGITVTGACTITVYATTTGSGRNIQLYDSEYEADDSQKYEVSTSEIVAYTFTITEAGTYYIVPSANISFYGIVITYSAEDAIEA